jgi:hypothetical protein
MPGGYADGGQIAALTWGSDIDNIDPADLDENISSVGIAAGRDVIVGGPTIIGEPPVGDFSASQIGFIDEGYGDIRAEAHGQDSILDADVAICALRDVIVDGDIEALAGTTSDSDNEHYANIKIAAGNRIAGTTGWIYAEADPSAYIAEASILLRTATGNIGIPITTDHFGVVDDDNPTFEKRGLPDIVVGPVDCPDCDFDWVDWLWCKDCEEEEQQLFTTAAPLGVAPIPPLRRRAFLQGGCPALMQWLANEVGVALM